MTSKTRSAFNRSFTNEAENVGTGSDTTSKNFDYSRLDYVETGGFFELLKEQDFSLAVTREYEHFLLLIDGSDEGSHQSPFPLPHPSGFWFDADTKELTVSSTRTPNIIISMVPYRTTEASSSILPPGYEPPILSSRGIDTGSVFLPRKAAYLPGSLYIHDVVKMQDEIYVTATGHNFLAKIDYDTGWKRVWWPKVIEAESKNAFNTNFIQLNSIAAKDTPEDSFYTGFASTTSGAKPWKYGFGPKGKGVVFSGKTREPLLTGLTCPHSAKLHNDKLWLCNSGYGSFGYVDGHSAHEPDKSRYVEVGRAPGFTRGMAFAGGYVFVGLSKVIDTYEQYAPGLEPATSKCGIWVFEESTGNLVACLSWPTGYQIYDVQVLPGMKQPRLPLDCRKEDGINPLLRFLG